MTSVFRWREWGAVLAKHKKTRQKADDEKKNTSLRLKSRTLKALKLRAIEEETSVQKIIESLIEDHLRNSGNET